MKRKTIDTNKIETEISQNLKEFSAMDEKALFEKLGTDRDGFNPIEADERLERYGKNVIETGTQKSFWQKVSSVVINPFNMVLLGVLAVTVVTDIVIPAEKSYSTALLIASTILISAIIGYTQEEKSNNAAQKLRKMITNKVDVFRNGVLTVIDITDVVPGDIVKLSSGDMLPGDVRFIEAKDLFINQATLTGESSPIEKHLSFQPVDSITDLANVGFMGTNITTGTAMAVVLATGKQTYFGSMAKSLSTDKEVSDFEAGINSISRLLIKFMLVMVPIIFVANLITKNDWLAAVLFSVTISIGLIPEMLPVIMTSTLAKGAVEMAKKETIVKRLPAIQTFGEMDVLCTDKTGTLTEDQIVLEKYMNADGLEDMNVLRQAFLNSYFQTGLKNAIDVAIIARAEKEGLNPLKISCARVNEIPFDFSRRRMSVVIKEAGSKDLTLVTKGAVEEMLSCCTTLKKDDGVVKLDEALKKKALELSNRESADGLRVLALAEKRTSPENGDLDDSDEADMTLIGFVGFLDPPKASALAAIQKLHEHGVRVVVLTGDTGGVAQNVCGKLGISADRCLTGSDVEAMTDDALKAAAETCCIFSKLNPYQKKRIVSLMQQSGHTVGYMGDGINDAPPLKAANVGISVDSAVDIAKEVADIILLEKDLNVLDEGVIGGRKTFVNLSKYIKMATSGNFGNMFSVVIASIFLPFLPMLPVHILIQNLLNDFAQLGMPWDNVDPAYLVKPKRINLKSLKDYMFTFGLASTFVDVLCFLTLWYLCGFNATASSLYFQTGWFAFGIVSQTLIIYFIRTQKIPFIQSSPSKPLMISTLAIVAITLILVFTPVAGVFGLARMPLFYLACLAALFVIYAALVQIIKPIYIRRQNGEWI